MKSLASVTRVIAAVALAGTASTVVQAQGLTREQVRAELAEAIRSGDYLVGGEMNLRLRDVSPGMYPNRHPSTSVKTREQVRAELAEAIRTGDIIVGEQGLTAYEQNPSRYPERPVVAGKTREQVREELALAIRLGDTPIDEQGLTPAERFPNQYAAVRAEHQLALKRQQTSQTVQRSGAAPLVR
jgi:ribosomal protein L30E